MLPPKKGLNIEIRQLSKPGQQQKEINTGLPSVPVLDEETVPQRKWHLKANRAKSYVWLVPKPLF